MSRTGDYLIGELEELSKKTGYDSAYLWARYFTVLNEFEAGYLDANEDPLDVLRKRAEAKAWGDPATLGKPEESTTDKKSVDTPKKQYICDPDANTPCNRSGCTLKGGNCFTTNNCDYATSDERGLPMEATPRRMLEFKALHGQVKFPDDFTAFGKDFRQLYELYSRQSARQNDALDSIGYWTRYLANQHAPGKFPTMFVPKRFYTPEDAQHNRYHRIPVDNMKAVHPDEHRLWTDRPTIQSLRYPAACHAQPLTTAGEANPTATLHDAETKKLLQHTNDTMWHMIAGAGIVLSTVAVGALLVLGILAFARGI